MATPSPVYRKFCALLGLLAFNDPCLAYDYKLSGFANQASTIGFNEAPINKSKGIYPMQQYATIAGYLSLGFSLLPKDLEKKGHSLKGLVGGMVGGVLFDGTKRFSGGSVVYQRFAFYDGFYGGGADVLQSDSTPVKNSKLSNFSHFYVFSDAYLDYKYKDYFGIKAGRYNSTAAYESGQTEGFEVFGQYKKVRLWWFSSFGRAYATGPLMRDWYAPRVVYSGDYTKNAQGGYTHHGHPVSLGTHAVQLTYKKHHLLVEGFYYFSPKMFNDPGFKIGWDSDPNFSGQGFRSNTILIAMFAFYPPWMIINSKGAAIYRYDNPVGANGQSLVIRQRFDINQFYVIGTFYKNFGNANAWVGNTGNPAGVEFYGNSTWAGYLGTALKADSVTGAIAYGGIHFKRKFTWNMTWQWSSAPVSYEGRFILALGYQFTPFLKALVNIAYYGVHTNEGYQAGLNAYCNPHLTYCGGGYQDRSALYTQLIATF
ncbi:outer membrane family protein [Helicobacter ailurogastricus]|uniref:Outer membrane protein n=2 Tax=Helicobacter ailurogastricus TaxID=1578720 RepID=A0A0K2XD33_9HELI|nr:outer membrane family protein [Helicobacter ailurogastricus]CRF41691.1 Outer membrane protein [Helicobacter ailurogastricus]CRF44432.1 Outer membrane protein [Helicobacter ailurogastricus]